MLKICGFAMFIFAGSFSTKLMIYGKIINITTYNSLMKFLGSLFLGLCFLIYALYCYQNGGSHHKGRGWVTKDEAPKTHIFNMTLIFVIGLSQIIFFAYANLKDF